MLTKYCKMLPVLSFSTNATVVDANDLTRPIKSSSVDRLVDDFKTRGALQSDDDDDSEMRQNWKEVVKTLQEVKEDESLDAELLILTEETDENRANELLDLGEKLLHRVLGGVSVARTETNVITSQKTTHATLNLYNRGIKLSELAYGVQGTSVKKVENFLASRAAAEFELLMLRFHNVNTLKHTPIRLKMHMQGTGRTLEIQRVDGKKAARALAAIER